MTGLGAPPWVARATRTAWDRLAEVAPDGAMPPPGNLRRLEELGCGHYGCVLPTTDARWVFKLTSDLSEAHFVAMALRFAERDGAWPLGLTRYSGVWALPGVAYRTRQVFALWRERAEVVGIWRVESALNYTDSWAYDATEYMEFYELLQRFTSAADVLRRLVAGRHPKVVAAGVDAWRNDPSVYRAGVELLWSSSMDAGNALRQRGPLPHRIGVVLQYLESIGQQMENTPYADAIGALFTDYLERGVVLADVHGGNVGLMDGTILVTDPGHAVILEPELEAIQVPVLD